MKSRFRFYQVQICAEVVTNFLSRNQTQPRRKFFSIQSFLWLRRDHFCFQLGANLFVMPSEVGMDNFYSYKLV